MKSKTDKPTITAVFGKPGAGKTTLTDSMKYHRVSDILVMSKLIDALEPHSSIVRQINEIRERGDLVDDRLICSIIKPYLVSGKNFIIDGFPRTVPQVDWLLESYSAEFNFEAFYLIVSNENADKRRLTRIENMRAAGHQPRADDLDEIAFAKRLSEFDNKTVKAVEYFRSKLGQNFYEINANQDKEIVAREIINILNNQMSPAIIRLLLAKIQQLRGINWLRGNRNR